MLSELSKYRSSVLCDARDGRTPPIGKLPVVDLDDAAQRAAEPEWHDYIRRVPPCCDTWFGRGPNRRRRRVADERSAAGWCR